MNTIRSTRSLASRTPARRRGFTLVELLVAVGAVALLAVGIAEIFRVTGRTVSTGRRVSALAQQASALERQMRLDFGRMTRDGFLLIRNERANSGGLTLRVAGDNLAVPRYGDSSDARRIDEIMFFATGDFVSARDPIFGTRTARAQQARIWWGHGARRDPSEAWLPVNLEDANFGAGAPGRPNPADPSVTGINTFAREWILARHETLLASPSTATDDVPGIPARRQRDHRFQIGLQPAAPSVFRDLIDRIEDDDPPRSEEGVIRADPEVLVPRFASGAVDIASTDLANVRAMVLSAYDPSTRYPLIPGNTFRVPRQANDLRLNLAFQQWWMRQALPADSHNEEGRGYQRLRVEPTAPNPLGQGWGGTAAEYQRTDQNMLAAHAFAPHCTNFIVEWSFGQLDSRPAINLGGGNVPNPNFGRLVWYGLRRAADVSEDGALVSYVLPYSEAGGNINSDVLLLRPTYKTRLGTSVNRRDTRNDVGDMDPDTDLVPTQALLRELIEGVRGLPGAPTEHTLTAHFGYVDPTYAPRLPRKADQKRHLDRILTNVRGNVDNNGVPLYEPLEGDVLLDPDTIPWPWPKLVRVTVTIADPNDPTVEQTFQYVFETPAPAGGAQ